MASVFLSTATGVIVGLGLGAVFGKILLGDPMLGLGVGVAAGGVIGLAVAMLR
jgi:hypothetical protein